MNDETTAALAASYDRVAAEYAARFWDELAAKPLDRALLDYFAEQVRGRGAVADLGCGPGQISRYLHERGLPVVGVDLSPEMVALARRLSPEMTFLQGSMLALDVEDGAWGGIVAFYSIIHVPPEELPRACAEFFRVLRPDGLALLSFHVGQERRHRDEWWEQPVSKHCCELRRRPLPRRPPCPQHPLRQPPGAGSHRTPSRSSAPSAPPRRPAAPPPRTGHVPRAAAPPTSRHSL